MTAAITTTIPIIANMFVNRLRRPRGVSLSLSVAPAWVTLEYSAMNLSIQHEESNGSTAVVRLGGRLLLGPGCLELEKLVADLLSRGIQHLTFDLTGVTHVDSTGMGRFIDAYSKLKK